MLLNIRMTRSFHVLLTDMIPNLDMNRFKNIATGNYVDKLKKERKPNLARTKKNPTLSQTKPYPILVKTLPYPRQKPYPIPDKVLKMIPYARLKSLKTIPYRAAHTRIANIGEYPPRVYMGLVADFDEVIAY